jgi:hypothetical protein
MQTSEFRLAMGAVRSIAADLGLAVDDEVVLRDSDRLMLRLLPCDVVARVARAGREPGFEIELAQRLAETGSPVGEVAPGVEPRVYRRDGFETTFWTYYEPIPPQDVAPAEYAEALLRYHEGLRKLDIPTPHFTDRVASALSIVGNRDRSPELPDADRELLVSALRTTSQAIEARGAPEQLLHGEPHPGNVLRTKDGLRFIDLETCCRGPVEYDIAYMVDLDTGGAYLPPDEVSEHYAGADPELVGLCRVLMLAMITAWRWNPEDQLPDRMRLARLWTAQLRGALEHDAR